MARSDVGDGILSHSVGIERTFEDYRLAGQEQNEMCSTFPIEPAVQMRNDHSSAKMSFQRHSSTHRDHPNQGYETNPSFGALDANFYQAPYAANFLAPEHVLGQGAENMEEDPEMMAPCAYRSSPPEQYLQYGGESFNYI